MKCHDAIHAYIKHVCSPDSNLQIYEYRHSRMILRIPRER